MKELVINRLKQLIADSDGEGIPRYFDCLESNYITDPDDLNDLSDDALLDALEASSLGYF